MISFGRHICNDFRIAVEKEWVLSNRKGSYSSSTILNTNTRKYHGLLVAKFPGIDNRVVVFPSLDEDMEKAGNIYHISTHKYKETVYPRGYSMLESFSFKNEVATFIYLIDNVRLKKEIFLMKKSNTVVVTYTLITPDSSAKFHVKPFIAFREADHLVREMPIFDPDVNMESNEKIKLSAYMNIPAAYIYNPDGGKIKIEGVWYRDFFYIREHQSGYDGVEDLYNIGQITLGLEYNNPKSLIFSTEDMERADTEKIRKQFNEEMVEMKQICADIGACVEDEEYRINIRQLINAADSFVVSDNKDKPYVIAGFLWPHYLWFRDTFASLPGLFLILKKFTEAKDILLESVKHEKNGLLPLRMTIDKNEIRYPSVDTTLWFFYAVYKYLEYTGDFSLVSKDSEFFKRLTWIIHKHTEGTEFNIKKDSDGLLYAGFPGLQLTWMDTAVNGAPVTPRQGKAVEINALWYNAVKTMEYISAKNGEMEMEKSYGSLAKKIKTSFNEKFWFDEGAYLYDYIEGDYFDESVRPNQVLALSLPFAVVTSPEKKKKVINTVIKELYTSFGLRTLSNMNVNFKSGYSGDQAAREQAAHQGTVWAWTVGHFVTAYFRAYGKNKESYRFVETVYEPFFEHLKNAGLGTISEMYDGNFPYTARGRISHGWAVAEIVRSYYEDFLEPNEKK